MSLCGHFHDACVREIHIATGHYVDETLSMTVDWNTTLHMLVQINRGGSRPWSCDLKRSSGCGSARRNRIAPTITDGASFLDAARRYYTKAVILDDDAEFKLQLVRKDGSWIILRSSQSQAFMIPWRVITPSQRFETYDAGISHVVMTLLPNVFLNRSRIGGNPHGWDFTYEIGSAMEQFLPR